MNHRTYQKNIQLRRDLLVHLFGSYEKYLTTESEKLIRLNKKNGGTADGLIYKGSQIYVNVGKPVRLRAPQEETIPAINQYLLELDIYKKERKEVDECLSLVLSRCRTPQDLKNNIPDYLVGSLSQMQKLPRTAEVLQCLDASPKKKKRVLDCFELLKKYIMYRSLYA